MSKKKIATLKLLCILIVAITVILSLSSCNSDKDFVAGHLAEFNIPEFHKEKLKGIEIVYRDYYYKDIPTPDVLTEQVASLYFEQFHDGIDSQNPSEVTTALINSYIATIGDKYSFYRNEEEHDQYETDMSGTFSGIGVSVIYSYQDQSMTVTEVYPDSGAADAGITIGDKIVKVNGIPLADIGYEKAVYTIRGEIGTTVDITVMRADVELTVTTTRKKVVEKSVSYSINESGIGYIKISAFNNNTASQFDTALDYMIENGAVGIVYDLRSNPGGYLSAVAKMLYRIAPKGTTVVSFSNDYSAPLKDKTSASLSLPTVVICNESTASAGELFTAAIRDFETLGYFDVTIVGQKTYGKGVMQSTYSFTDNSSITLTVAYYNPPSGENYDGVGITPDVTVESGGETDEQLDAAYIEINKLIK